MKKTILALAVALFLLLSAPESKASTACASVNGNLVANCGFETGTFSSWTLTGNDTPGELDNLYGVEGTDPVDNISPLDGADQAFFADLDSNATTLSQTLLTTAADTYTITFFAAQDTTATTGYPNELLVSFGGTSLAALSDVAAEGYTKYTYTGTATSGSTSLSLTFGDGLGEFLLDDVSVTQNASLTATPEPSSVMLLATGLAGIVLLAMRRKLVF